MRVAVLGPGGVGALLAGALSRAGHEVTVIVRPGAEHPASIHVESQVLGDFEAPVRVAARLDVPVDVLVVAVKAPQLEAALGQAPAGLVEGVAVPFLNGVDHVGVLEAAYGPDRVAAGVIRVEAERREPGHVVQLGGFIGVEVAGAQPAARALVEALAETGISARQVEDRDLALWSKLVLLAPMALVTTASGLDLGGARADPVWRARLEGAMREVAAVAAAEGHRVDAPLAFIDGAHPSMRTSMQKDAEAGRPLEVDHLAGPVLDGGRRHGVPTPVTAELVAAVKARHRG